MERVSVVGNSGSGKTTLATAIAAALDAPHLELDSVFHLPGWTELPVEEFRGRVAGFVAGERWVVDGNYTAVRDLVWARADTVVWLDYPRRVVMRQVVSRTLRRLVTRQELWNGNREPWRNLASLDPQRSIIAWAWSRHSLYRQQFSAAAADPAYRTIRFVRLERPRGAADLVARLAAGHRQ